MYKDDRLEELLQTATPIQRDLYEELAEYLKSEYATSFTMFEQSEAMEDLPFDFWLSIIEALDMKSAFDDAYIDYATSRRRKNWVESRNK